MQIQVDQTFRNLIPPLSDQERSQLEESILAEGVRNPLVVGKFTFGPKHILLDGYHRYEIAQKHGIPFSVVEIEFGSYLDAVLWMAKNQMGKRNLSPWARVLLAREMRPLFEQQARARQAKAARATNSKLGRTGHDETLGQQIDGASGRVPDELARLATVSPETFRRAEYVLDHAADIQPRRAQEIRRQLDSGELSISAAWRLTQVSGRRWDRKQESNERVREARERPRLKEFILGKCEDELHRLEPMSVRLLCTDPPYGQAWVPPGAYVPEHERGIHGDRTVAEATTDFERMLKAIEQAMLPDCHAFVFTSAQAEPDFRRALESHGYEYRASLIWDKQHGGMGDPRSVIHRHERILYYRRGNAVLLKRLEDVLSFPRARATGVTAHSTPKPTNLLRKLIEATTVEGELCVDPFAGSASTLVAAEQLGRAWFGCEMEERFYKEGRRRLTGPEVAEPFEADGAQSVVDAVEDASVPTQ